MSFSGLCKEIVRHRRAALVKVVTAAFDASFMGSAKEKGMTRSECDHIDQTDEIFMCYSFTRVPGANGSEILKLNLQEDSRYPNDEDAVGKNR